MGVPTAQVLDFTHADLKPNGKPEIDPQGRPPEAQGGRPITSSQAKQLRARARRRKSISDSELAKLYKPLDEWDHEELARGRPRAKDGSFKGKAPTYIDRALHEQIVKKFETVVRSEMNGHTVAALRLLGEVLDTDDIDDKGRPVVPAGVKVDVAKFLVEHVIGKPKQRTETDISIKLQGILAHAMVNPSQSEPGQFELTQGYIEADSWEDEDDAQAD